MTSDSKAALLAELMMKAHLAKRDQFIVGDEEHPTPWDLTHRRIDELLDKLEAKPPMILS